MKKLIICGTGAQSELAYIYFSKDSDYEVVAFTIEQAYLRETHLLGLPVFPFEEIEKYISPEEADMYIAIGPIKLCSVMEHFCIAAKGKGYTLASYCPTVVKNYFEPSYGENCFIDHVAQFHPLVKIGNGVTIMNSEIAHHSEIGDFSFLTCAMLGGRVIVEDHVFIGMKTVIKEGVRIGKGSIIGMGCVITKDVEPYSVYSVSGTKAREGVDSRDIELFRKQ